MATYTLAIGTHDPLDLVADSDGAAIALAVARIRSQSDAVLREHPEDVVTLLGPGGLVTRASERLDEFVHRVPGPEAAGLVDTIQPGDANTPDCNGD